MSESIVWIKRPENQSRILKWKLWSVMEWKCSENINQYIILTRILQKVTRKYECFSRIVEPWIASHLNALNIKKTYDIGNPDPGLGQT